DVVVNDRPTGRIAEFVEENGHLRATPQDLRELGLDVAARGDGADGRIALAQIPGLRYDIDHKSQLVRIKAPAGAVAGTIIGTDDTASPALRAQSATGFLVNYDALATRESGRTYVSALGEARLFSPWGVLSNTGLVAYGTGARIRTTRLDSTWTYSEPLTLRRYRVGDLITSGLAWTRPMRLGGAQVTTDFALRPDLVTFPTPDIRGETAVPSTVDVFVNGVRQLSQPVTDGPFSVRGLPVMTGFGDVVVVVRDALGRERYQNLNFYASNDLLREGLSAYAAEAGVVRRNYGLRSLDYGGPAGGATYRYGLTPWLTAEGHGEAGLGTAVLGFGGVVALGAFGRVAGAFSTSRRGGTFGVQRYISYERRSPRWNVFASSQRASRGYRDVPAIADRSALRFLNQAGAGLTFNGMGSISVALTDIKYSRGPRQQFVSGTYNVSILESASLFVTGFASLRDRTYGATIGLAVPFGTQITAGGDVSVDRDGWRATVQAAQTPPYEGGFGWRLSNTEGSFTRREATLTYQSNLGDVEATAAQFGKVRGVRAGARGSLTLANGALFPGRFIDDSFAVVDTSGIGGIVVSNENRTVGATDRSGTLLVRDLRAYQPNRIAIDPQTIPNKTEVGRDVVEVVPADRSGVVVRFGVQPIEAAVVTLTLDDGRFVPVGAQGTLQSTGERTWVGYDGQIYFRHLKADNVVVVEGPFGQCRASFAYQPARDGATAVGPVRCQHL
ncbi:MAG TPA: fimbria/pilus outer membrane usher protein, partial [Vineibacter sp.]|nr:fimbria/pilus outer membrane usher protein [Vineibacter sp.]